jgi:hypothetical protein
MEFFDTYWYLLPIGIFSAVFYIIYLSLRDNLIVYIKDSFRQASVLKTGIGANADIIVARQTGMWDAENPVYLLTVNFKTREGQEVQASFYTSMNFEEENALKPVMAPPSNMTPKTRKELRYTIGHSY